MSKRDRTLDACTRSGRELVPNDVERGMSQENSGALILLAGTCRANEQDDGSGF